MKKLLTALIAILFTLPALAQTDTGKYKDFNAFNNEVLKGHVKKQEAQMVIGRFVQQVTKDYLSQAQPGAAQQWIFPLQGYNYRAAGGTNGNGYNDKGFNYIDGNKHGAHPAHDIFINDKNQDCLDDRTHQPVNVLAIAPGIIVACTNQWDLTGDMRGGKYIWIYHPGLNADAGYFSYYAHNSAIFVHPGDYVKQGQKIAEVGRTGLNAYKKRSPTHLHFSTFKLVDNIPVPFNSFKQLKSAIIK
ncbi:M23 family metallopeptidase [Mucilaginibacter sp.]|uniref:M23 family metallopeptidase n=1 Tax=Mucilaginibacter sp. TaxID=1882438 RepID=UPI0032644D6A